MSLASLIISASRNETRWKAIPVFPSRRFFHTWILCNRSSAIDSPVRLKSKKVGVPEYQMTAAVWVRGILQDEFLVNSEEMKWYQERLENRITIEIPKKVVLVKLPPEENLAEMLVTNKLDALLVYSGNPTSVDRSTLRLDSHPNVNLLFPDPKSEEIRYYKKTGIFPINHTIVIKNEVYEENHEIGMALFRMFDEAKKMSYRELDDHDFVTPPNLVWQREAFQEQKTVFGNDPYPYGFKQNLKTLQTLSRYCYDQGLSKREVNVEELFAEEALDI